MRDNKKLDFSIDKNTYHVSILYSHPIDKFDKITLYINSIILILR